MLVFITILPMVPLVPRSQTNGIIQPNPVPVKGILILVGGHFNTKRLKKRVPMNVFRKFALDT